MAKPFTKHPGGKRDHVVISFLTSVLQTQPEVDTFIDPTFGGGSVFFALESAGLLVKKTVIVGDKDADLISLTDAVRARPEAVYRLAAKEATNLAGAPPREQKSMYNTNRELFNLGDKKPGLQLFLRHACFNGLFRRNRSGKLNTPPRDRLDQIFIPSIDDLKECAAALQNVELLDWDFRQYEDEEDLFIGPNTLVYLDPPYDGGFVNYVADGFTENDQRDLIMLASEWAARGATVVYSNSATSLVCDLLRELWPEARVEYINARRSISSDGDRQPAAEVLVHNTTLEAIANAAA